MQSINILGQELRTLRRDSKQSLLVTAKAVGVDRSHLNKIELGIYKPSLELLDKILAHFSLGGSKANQLRTLLKHEQVEHAVVEGLYERGINMADNALLKQPPANQVTIDPAKTPVMYTDSTFVSSSDYGLVLDIAQKTPDGQQQFVVARVGMSFDHAKKLLEVISDHLEKNER